MILLAPFAFAFFGGMVAGSFASVIAHRVPRGENWATGRSRCPGCGHQIAAYDNVPVLSWLALRGRCRSCGEHISARYPLAEIAMAVLFTATALVIGFDDPAELAMGLIFCAMLVTITLTDLEQRIIPNAILAAGAVAAVAIAAATDPSSLSERAIAAAGGGAFMLAFAIAYPRGMGMGDVKLVAVMGLFLGSALDPRASRRGPRRRARRPGRPSFATAPRLASTRSRSDPSSPSGASSAFWPATRCSTGTSTPSSGERRAHDHRKRVWRRALLTPMG